MTSKMIPYRYTGRSIDGSRMNGEISAKSPEEATRRLQDAGISITVLVPAKRKKHRIPKRILLTDSERLFILESWISFLDAGITIQSCLLRLQMRTHNRPLRLGLEQIQEDIDEGLLLSQALKKTPLFPPTWISILTMSEKAGEFIEPLRVLAKYAREARRFRNKVLSSLVMPAILFCMVVVWIWIFLVKIIPSLVALVRELGGPLPNLLAKMLSLSSLLAAVFPWAFLALMIFLFLGLIRRRANQELGWFEGHIPVQLPVVGPMARNFQTLIIARGLELQLNGGVSMHDAVQTLSFGMSASSARRDLYLAYQKLTDGVPIAEAMAHVEAISPLGHSMLAAGVVSGRIPELLHNVARHTQSELIEQVRRLMILIRSTVIILVGLMVGVLVIIFFTLILETISAAGLLSQNLL